MKKFKKVLTKKEQIMDSQVYDKMLNEVKLICGAVQKWMIDAGQRVTEERSERKSTRGRVQS